MAESASEFEAPSGGSLGGELPGDMSSGETLDGAEFQDNLYAQPASATEEALGCVRPRYV